MKHLRLFERLRNLVGHVEGLFEHLTGGSKLASLHQPGADGQGCGDQRALVRADGALGHGLTLSRLD